MSLRPSFAGFVLADFRALIGSNRMSALPALLTRYDDAVDDPVEQEHGHEIIRALLQGGLRVAVEDAHVVNAIISTVLASQVLLESSSLFWESFLVQVAEADAQLPGAPTELLACLLKGRPLIGTSIEPAWALYAFFASAEAASLFKFIRGHAPFLKEFGFSEAEEWMSQVEARGLDVFYFAS